MPSSLQAQITRNAISPRLAIRTFRNIGGSNLTWTQSEERLAVLNGLAVLNETFHNLARRVCFDLIHQLHGLDDAEDLAVFHLVANLHECQRPRRGRLIEGADD